MEKIEEIFNEAVALPAEARRAFVAANSEGELREKILRLLASDDDCENFFLDEPAFALAALLASDEDERNLIEKENSANYRLLKIIGRGGMGIVFLARDKRLDRQAALNVLPASLNLDAEAINRFRREARHASSVAHKSVAYIYEFGEYENRFYLAMEYMPGRTLRELIREKLIGQPRALI